MATARKAPAKRAAPQGTAAKQRTGSARAAGSSGTAGAAAGTEPALKRKAAPKAPSIEVDARAAKPSRAREAKLNGASEPVAREKVVREKVVHEKRGDATRDAEGTRKPRALTPASPDAAVPVPIAPREPSLSRPAYWERACADLVKRDRILKRLIPLFGPGHLINGSDPFVTLARSVVGQQISVPAAQAVWQRIELACPRVAPQQFIKLGQGKLIDCGLSKRKTDYLLDLAQHFVSGALHVDKWASMDDEAVIDELTQIRGIGRWTAEMFLIFNLSRPNVLPLDDLSLIRAISLNYFSGEPVTRSEAREVAANWEPWRTVATWYMWRSLDSTVEA
jgi:DNA-3-methyladenine glycosylase II